MQTLTSITSQRHATGLHPSLDINMCHSCDVHGGCLNTSLMEESGSGQLSQAKRIYRKDEHVFREAEISKSFFVVRSGTVKTYFLSEDGEEQILGFYLPGDVFGLDIGDDQQRASSAMALETTTICRFPLESLAARDIPLKLLKLTSVQMTRDHHLVLMLARKNADGRIASFLGDLAQRHHTRGFSGSKFSLSMSRQDIACYLGLAVETVSRTLTRFQDSGVLKVDRREVEIVQPDALFAIGGSQATRVA